MTSTRSKGRGRSILAVSARTVGRGLLRSVTRTDAGAHWAKVGEDWYQTLGELKGAAMKLGQLASQYQDLLPPELASQLARLQADAQHLDWSVIQDALEESWTSEHWDQLAHIDFTPLASASIGQVHKGRLVSGPEVAIKIRYPGVAEAMGSDIKNLSRILRAAGILPLDKTSLDGLLEEIRDRMSEEMDYARERAYLEEFAALPARDGIVIPRVLPQLCTNAVLVTQFLPGHSLETARSWPQTLRDEIGTRYIDWLLDQIFDYGLVHADPHPGNFSFRDSGEIVVYDFGCVKRINPQNQHTLACQLKAVVDEDWQELHRQLGRIGNLSNPQSAMTESLQALYETNALFFKQRLLQTPFFDFSDTDFIPEARKQLRQALPHWRHFKPVPELAFVARAISGGYWLVRRLGARVDLQSRVAQITRRLI